MLSKFNLFRRKSKPVGQTLEKGREGAERRRIQKNRLVKAGIFAVLLLLTWLAFPQVTVYEYTVAVGDAWQRETLESPVDFPIYKTPDSLAAERRRVRERVAPVFAPFPEAEADIEANRRRVEEQLNSLFETYENMLANRARGRIREAEQDSLAFLEYRRLARVKLTPSQWQRLLDDYAQRVPGLDAATREVLPGPPLAYQLLDLAAQSSRSRLELGVIDQPLDSVLTEQIRIRIDETNEVVRSKSALWGLEDASDLTVRTLEPVLAERFPDEPPLTSITVAFFRALFVPNLRYLRAETLALYADEVAGMSPTFGKVSQGEVIVREGQTISAEARAKLLSLERFMADEGGPTFVWRRSLGQFLMILGTYAIFFLYLFALRRHIFDDNRRVVPIALLFLVLIGLFAVVLRAPDFIDVYLVPVTIASLLLTVMFDSRVGLFATLTMALIGGQMLNYDFEFAFATIFAGTLGIFSVRDIKNRGQFFVSSSVIFLGYAFVLTASYFFQQGTLERYGLEILYVAGNAFFVLMAYPLLWFFERAFDITTDLTLLELSNTNRPLLRELSVKAPGSFNHSLQVANLAEAAAGGIGANALLARVGALYHDIGKMSKPEYFVENQRAGLNPHTQLKPRMSALIIASHVKEGMEMGRKAKLPKRVLDFIPSHHGTSRIEYFYRKAVEQAEGDESAVQDAEFRYPGPRPHSKETGILMLADSVEAASRSLAEPTHKRLEALVDMIFKARTEDGQLSDTDLTFRELAQVRETFLSVLMGIYHVRVKYPGQEEEQEAKSPPSPEPVPAAEAPSATALPEAAPAGDGVPEAASTVPQPASEGASAAEEPDAPRSGSAS
ncbi:MAG: HDIG domain-containing metalloprotein [Bacteroidota bacterium]